MINKDPYQDSFMVYDPSRIQEIMKDWNQTIPWIKIRYAVKCNPLKCLLKDLNALGCGFDVASIGELQRLIDIGVNPEKIIFSNPFKIEKAIILASNYGVPITVADTVGEIQKIQTLAPKMKILWRISVSESKKQHGTISFADKFGDPMNSLSEIQSKLKELRQSGYLLSGIHFHAGSNHLGSDNFQEWLTVARQCMIAGKQAGHPMEILDIGGGFAGNFINETFTQVLQYTEKDPIGCQFIAEPGRHIASRLFKICCRVIGKRENGNKTCIYINDGIFHAFNKVFTDGVSFNGRKLFEFSNDNNVFRKSLAENDDEDGLIKAIIYGMTCDGQDIVAEDVLIPKDIQIGDWFVFGGMGAYTYSLISNFNSMASCQNILVLNDKEIVVPSQDEKGQDGEIFDEVNASIGSGIANMNIDPYHFMKEGVAQNEPGILQDDAMLPQFTQSDYDQQTIY